MDTPLLSIVIANYNYGRFIEQAIQSVVSQATDEVELIICDAASTDNSVEIIRKYAGGLPPNTERCDPSFLHLPPTPISWWCSERDGGQSAAFNKGFSHARGKYLTWLNADDVLVPGCLAKIIRAMRLHPDCHWFTGNFLRFLTDGKVMEIGWGPHWYPRFLQRRNSPLVIFGPTTFFSREIYETYGPIDERMHLMMDVDLWYRFMVAGVKQRRINTLIWGFRMHEDSKTAEFGDHKLDEKRVARFAAENRMADEQSHYRCSKFLRTICLSLRVLDGSLLVRQLLIWTCRQFNVGGVS